MKIGGVEYGPIFCAAGALGFYGEGQWFHLYLKPFGLNFDNATFITSTITCNPNKGNMPRDKKTFKPIEKKPKCIKVKFAKGIALNAVGLSNFGMEKHLDKGIWQNFEKPFGISVMAIKKKKRQRITEIREIAKLLKQHKFKAPFFLQVNFTCPNIGADIGYSDDKIDEMTEILKILNEVVPVQPKFNVLMPMDALKRLNRKFRIETLCISNSIPWGALPDKIDWKKLWGSEKSPLEHLGGGAMSGKHLRPLVEEWIKGVHVAGMHKIIILAGGGILHPDDVGRLFCAGADAVFIGSAAFLRPWRVGSIVKSAQKSGALLKDIKDMF